ncbi:MAG: replication initiation protein [Pseudomonadales bacterium]|nr:replication initiation protein [Pseudomonadales bacterium]
MAKTTRNKQQLAIPTGPDINAEQLVMKDNALIMASYSLTVEEQRLILACIEKAQRQKDPLASRAIEITLTVQEYADLYNVKMGTAYKALSASSNKLYERSIRIDEEGLTRKVRWLQEQANYDSGKVCLRFSDTISRHIRDIVTEQTAFRLEQATQLRTQHSIRLFEILNMVLDPITQEGEWTVSVDKLKDTFEVQGYDRWIDLKKRVISPSVQQINKYTSLRVDWQVTGKEGKRISEIRFTVFESDQLSLGLN